MLSAIYQFFRLATPEPNQKILPHLNKQDAISELDVAILSMHSALKNSPGSVASMRSAYTDSLLSSSKYASSNQHTNTIGLELAGSGMFSNVYDMSDGNLIKVSKEGAQNNFQQEVFFFNEFYGAGSAIFINSTCFKMKKIAGKPLSKIPDHGDIIPYECVTDMLNQLKEKGIYHGDLKPENVLWDNKSKKLMPIDFGKSYQLESGVLEQPLFGW